MLRSAADRIYGERTMLKLYDVPISGNCQKVRMMLSILGIEYEKIPVSLPDGEQKTPAYLSINPMGKVPAIDDNGTLVWDSQAILVYLASKYGSTDWYPDDAVERGQCSNGWRWPRTRCLTARPLRAP
jgi:glutathione S-transferase